MADYNSESWVRDHSDGALVLRPVALSPARLGADFFRAVQNETSPTVRDFFKSNLPLTVGAVSNPEDFAHDLSPAGNCSFKVMGVIKAPGTDYFLPEYLSQFAPVIQDVIDIEHGAHPTTKSRYCLLLVDQNVPGMGYMRIPEFHRDGDYRDVCDPAWRTAITYSTTNIFPTIFSARTPEEAEVHHALQENFNDCAGIIAGQRDIKNLIFALVDVLDRHIEARTEPGDIYRAAPLDIVRFNILCPHKSPKVENSDAQRTFVNVLFVDSLGGPEFPNARRYLPFNPWLQKAMASGL